MTSAEKILQGITDDANAQAARIIADSDNECARITAEGAEKAAQVKAAIEADAARKAEMINSTGASGAALIRRDNTLSAKRERIDAVLDAVAKKINDMPDDEYFAFFADVIKHGQMQKGVLKFGGRDAGRDFGKIEALLAGTDIKVAGAACDIEDGFVLEDGDIEINGTLRALIHEKYNDLVDTVNPILF